MSDRVDELFGGGGRAARPRSVLVACLLVSGLLGTVAGLACSTVPGGLVVLAAWLVVEKEMDRVDSGFLPADTRGGLAVLRSLVRIGVVVAVVLIALQLVLMSLGVYEPYWFAGLAWALGLEPALP